MYGNAVCTKVCKWTLWRSGLFSEVPINTVITVYIRSFFFHSLNSDCVNPGAIILPFPAWVLVFIVIGALLILGVIIFALIKIIISILVSKGNFIKSIDIGE